MKQIHECSVAIISRGWQNYTSQDIYMFHALKYIMCLGASRFIDVLPDNFTCTGKSYTIASVPAN